MGTLKFELEFGTGGLRAVMGPGGDQMNDMTVAMATQGLANYILKFAGSSRVSVVISFDCRNHSEDFARIAAKVLAANGIDVFIFESLRPTPKMSYAIRLKGAIAEIMITASHNPPEYNGYKVSWQDGGQITSPVDKDIVAEVGKIKDSSEVRFEPLDGIVAGKIVTMGANEDECYLRDILSLTLSHDSVKRHSDLRIVYTPLHGCGVRLVPECLRRLGFTNVYHVPEQDINDGNFPTVSSPNPEEAPAWEMAFEVAEREKADLILATDPDADRMGAAVRNREGRLVRLTGNQTAAILTWYILSRRKELGTLREGCYVVKTIVTTELIADIAQEFGVPCHNVLTGWKYLAEQVKIHEDDGEFVCGGEESCGFNAGQFVRDKDAQLASSLLAECAAWAADKGKTLCDVLQDLYDKYGYWEETRFSLVRKGREGASEIRQRLKDLRENPPTHLAGLPVVKVIDYLQSGKTGLPSSDVIQFFTSEGDIISVRPSGTEPKIRFYYSVNGPDASKKTELLKKEFLS
jgi:phosphoglucomutase